MVNTYYPPWWSTLPKSDGNPFGRLEGWAYNRTNAALVKGHVYQFDTNWTLSATTETVANSETILLPPVANWKADHIASAWRNLVVAPTQVAAQYGWNAVALENTPDNEKARILLQGECTLVSIAGTDNLLQPPGSPLMMVLSASVPIWAPVSKAERKIAFNLAAVQYADTASAAVIPAAQSVDVFFCGFGYHMA